MYNPATIKNCPFCGGSAWFECTPDGSMVWVECKACAARSPMVRVDSTPAFRTSEEAYAYAHGAWERRANEDAE